MGLDLGFMRDTFILSAGAIPVTLGITAATLVLSVPLAFALALTRVYRIGILDGLTAAYVSLVRGTPVVLQILLVYSLLPSALNALALRLALPIRVFDVNPLWYAIAVFTLNTTALFSEVFRSAAATVDRGQIEAALSAGLSLPQAWRRIVIPQAIVVALPNLANGTVNLIKGTSLAFMMSVKDVTAVAKIEASYGYNFIEAYLVIFAIYVVLCLGAQGLFGALERKLGAFRRGRQ